MPYIILACVVGILALHLTEGIPDSSVGGPMVIAAVAFAGALALAIYEAWTQRRGILGWIVNIVLAFVGVFIAAQLGGLFMVTLLSGFMDGTSLARSSGPIAGIALTGVMVLSLLGAWGAIQFANRWR